MKKQDENKMFSYSTHFFMCGVYIPRKNNLPSSTVGLDVLHVFRNDIDSTKDVSSIFSCKYFQKGKFSETTQPQSLSS